MNKYKKITLDVEGIEISPFTSRDIEVTLYCDIKQLCDELVETEGFFDAMSDIGFVLEDVPEKKLDDFDEDERMGRKLKERLDYFPMDVDMFRDPKIMRLIRNANGGAEAVTVYTMLLCRIYEQGYWVKIDSNLTFTIAVDANLSEERVFDVIGICVHLGLFDAPTYEMENVLTSHGIQERYLEIKGKCKNKATINEYCLISSEEMSENEQESTFIPKKCPENNISSEEMSENERKTEFPLKNKEKEKDKNINSSSTTSPAREGKSLKEQENEWYGKAMNDAEYISDSTKGLTETTRQEVGVEAFKAFGAAFHTEKLAVKEWHSSYEHYCKHLYEWTRRQIEIKQEMQAKAGRKRGSSSSGGKPAAVGVGVVAERVEGVDKATEERELMISTWYDAMGGNARSVKLVKAWIENGRLKANGFEADFEKKTLLENGKEVEA